MVLLDRIMKFLVYSDNLILFVTVMQQEIFNTYYVFTFITYLLAKCYTVHRLQTANRKEKKFHTSEMTYYFILKKNYFSNFICISFKDILQFATRNPNLSVLPCNKFARPLCTCYWIWEIWILLKWGEGEWRNNHDNFVKIHETFEVFK